MLGRPECGFPVACSHLSAPYRGQRSRRRVLIKARKLPPCCSESGSLFPSCGGCCAGLFALSVLLAVGAYLGPVWGIGTALATVMVAAAIFVSAAVVITHRCAGNPDRPGQHRACLYRRKSCADC